MMWRRFIPDEVDLTGLNHLRNQCGRNKRGKEVSIKYE